MSQTAIVSLVYNRKQSLRRQLASLEQASYPEAVDLVISIDKSDTDEVENFADCYEWPFGQKRVIRHDRRMGTRKHVMSLAQLFETYDVLIVLEDDITVAPSFYLYAKACVNRYQDDMRIAGISLYSFNINYQNELPFTPLKSPWDVFFINCAQSWGQVWMKQQWMDFHQWYDKHSENFHIDSLPPCLNMWPDKSWLKYHTRYCIEEDKYFVYPYFALSTNNAEPGVNQKEADSLFQSNMMWGVKDTFSLPSLDECEVRYDGFFNPKFLADYLHIVSSELTVDLYGNTPLQYSRNYLLSTRALPFKVLRQFSLELHPMEMNIIQQREGNGIWLYDTKQSHEPPSEYDGYRLFYHYYRKALFVGRKMIGIRGAIRLACKTLITKIKG